MSSNYLKTYNGSTHRFTSSGPDSVINIISGTNESLNIGSTNNSTSITGTTISINTSLFNQDGNIVIGQNNLPQVWGVPVQNGLSEILNFNYITNTWVVNAPYYNAMSVSNSHTYTLVAISGPNTPSSTYSAQFSNSGAIYIYAYNDNTSSWYTYFLGTPSGFNNMTYVFSPSGVLTCTNTDTNTTIFTITPTVQGILPYYLMYDYSPVDPYGDLLIVDSNNKVLYSAIGAVAIGASPYETVSPYNSITSGSGPYDIGLSSIYYDGVNQVLYPTNVSTETLYVSNITNNSLYSENLNIYTTGSTTSVSVTTPSFVIDSTALIINTNFNDGDMSVLTGLPQINYWNSVNYGTNIINQSNYPNLWFSGVTVIESAPSYLNAAYLSNTASPGGEAALSFNFGHSIEYWGNNTYVTLGPGSGTNNSQYIFREDGTFIGYDLQTGQGFLTITPTVPGQLPYYFMQDWNSNTNQGDLLIVDSTNKVIYSAAGFTPIGTVPATSVSNQNSLISIVGPWAVGASSLVYNGQTDTLFTENISGTSASFSIENVNNTGLLPSLNYLIVGGGGAGGYEGWGGGGAGGLLTGTVSGSSTTVIVGFGGTQGNTGQNSSAFSLVAYGGGYGGFNSYGGNGGSGGGADYPNYAYLPGTGFIGQGYNGGLGGNTLQAGGSGGGAGTVGSTSNTTIGPNGGAGLLLTISGSSQYYAGGGGGSGMTTGGSGGSSIGGHGGNNNTSVTTTNGQANTGSGGGGGGLTVTNPGSGGSGIVIISYPGPQLATGGTITSFGNYTIHTFLTSGSFIMNSALTVVGGITSDYLSVYNTISGYQFISTATTGTPPLVVSSTTLVPNLYVHRAQIADGTGGSANSLGLGATGFSLVLTGSISASNLGGSSGPGSLGIGATGYSLVLKGTESALQYTSTVSGTSGTPPFVVSSSTLVPILYVSRAQTADSITNYGYTGLGTTIVLQNAPTINNLECDNFNSVSGDVNFVNDVLTVTSSTGIYLQPNGGSLSGLSVESTQMSYTSAQSEPALFFINNGTFSMNNNNNATNQTNAPAIFSGGVGIARDLYAQNIYGRQLTSTVANTSGVPPLVVHSSTLVPVLYVARAAIADNAGGSGSGSLSNGATGFSLTLTGSVSSQQYTSTVGTGTAPLVVSSTTLVPNLYVSRSQTADTASSLTDATGSSLTLTNTLSAPQLVSTVATGTAPLVVSSTTLVPNLYVSTCQTADTSNSLSSISSGGALSLSGNLTVSGNGSFIGTLLQGKVVAVNSSNASTTVSTGALTVQGGVGIVGSIHMGGTLYVPQVLISSSTDTTATTTGALIVQGGVGIVDSVRMGGTLYVPQVLISSSTDTIGATTGALQVLGGVGISSSLTVGSTTACTSASTGALIVQGGTGIEGILRTGNGRALLTAPTFQAGVNGYQVINFYPTSGYNTFTFAQSNTGYFTNTSGRDMYLQCNYQLPINTVAAGGVTISFLSVNSTSSATQAGGSTYQYGYNYKVQSSTVGASVHDGSAMVKLPNNQYLALIANLPSTTSFTGGTIGANTLSIYELP